VLATQPSVEVKDTGGNVVKDVVVTVASSAGTLDGTKTATTGTDGVATFSGLKLNGTVGNYTLSFSATGASSATSNAINLSAGTATQLVIITEPSSEPKSGQVFVQSPVLVVRDASGNPVSGIRVTVASSGSGALTGTKFKDSDNDGKVTFSDLKLNGTVGEYTLGFSALGALNATSTKINLSAGTATQLAVKTQPSATAKSGEVMATQPSVEAKDADGNVVKDVVVTVASSGGTLDGTKTATTGTDGVATFSGLKLNGTVGNYTLSFSATGGLNATSSSISLSVGTATQLAVKTQPSATAKSGEVLSTQPSIEIKDADGNVVKDVVVTVASSGGTLTGTTTATSGIDGVATFSGLTITGAAAEYSMTFTAGALSATSAKINLSAGAATKLVILTQPSTSAESNVVLPSQPVVQLQDASGNGVNQPGSVTVSIIETTGSPAPTLAGSLSASMDTNGLASFNNLRLDGGVSKLKMLFSAAGFTVKSDEITLAADRDRDGDGILTSIERARGLNPDSMDSNGNGLTDTYEFSYIGTTDPFLPRVGDYIKLDFSSLKTPTENRYNILGKLPAGLAFNKTTGVLAGKLSGKEETVTLTLQFMNGKVVMRTVSLPIPIKRFPKGIAGTFQALLGNTSGLQGMVSATLTAPGSWSATLDMRGRKKVLAAKGLFDLNPNEDTVTLRLSFPATPGVAATSLTLEIDGAFNLIDGTYTSGTTNGIVNGFRMAQGDELAMVKNMVKANKPYTLVLDQGSQNGTVAPGGVGTATALLAQAGTIALNGQLGDAQAVKGSLRVSATGQAIVWLKPYKNATSYIGGVFDLPAGILTNTPSESLETGLNWVRAADSTETSYVSGFTIDIETPFMSEFVPRTKSTDLAADLGLTNSRFNVLLEGNDIEAQTGLPDKFDLNASFGLIVPSPVANGVAWKKGLINKANGKITGALALKKVDLVNAGDAPVFGVVYKSGDNTRGIGLVKIPFVEDKKTRFRTNAIILSK